MRHRTNATLLITVRCGTVRMLWRWAPLTLFPQLSVLDTTPVGPGIEYSLALQWTTESAKLSDRLGFDRFWVTEHHGASNAGCATPAVLIAHLASVTQRLRVGAGAVLLPNHPPLFVAEEFAMLEALHPGRIDLGIGRGLGASEDALSALRRAPSSDSAYLNQIDELVDFLSCKSEREAKSTKIRLPNRRTVPEIFVVGSSISSALLAASRGRPFAFAHYQNPTATTEAVSKYCESFCGRQGAKPYSIVAVRVVGRKTDKEAEAAAIFATVVDARVTAAEKHDLEIDKAVLLDPATSPREQTIARDYLARGAALIGGVDRLHDDFLALADLLKVDEIMVSPLDHNGASRLHTLAAVAETR